MCIYMYYFIVKHIDAYSTGAVYYYFYLLLKSLYVAVKEHAEWTDGVGGSTCGMPASLHMCRLL